MSTCMAERHAGYQKFLRTLLRHIAFMYRVRAMLLQQQDAGQQHQQQQQHTARTNHRQSIPRTPATKPPFHTQPNSTRPQYLRQLLTIQQCPVAVSKHPATPQLQHFLVHMPMLIYGDPTGEQESTHHGMGITWLELYILYRLTGNPPPLKNPAQPAATRPTLRYQLHTFRAGVRTLERLTMPAPTHSGCLREQSPTRVA